MAWQATLTDVSFLKDDTVLPPKSYLVVEVTYKGIKDTVLVRLGTGPTVEALRDTAAGLHARASREFKRQQGLHSCVRCTSKIVGIDTNSFFA